MRWPALPVGELFAALRRSLAADGWLDACKAACVAFLAALCAGAVLVVAAKLGHPRLGAGANPISVLTAVVILTLGSLGSPITIGAVEVRALPLGALAVVGWAIAWATAQIVAARGVSGSRAAALEGAKTGIPFALLSWVAALVFRYRSPVTPVAAGAGEALAAGVAWGCLFGALGGWAAVGPAGRRATDLLERLRRRSQAAYEGVAAGAVMLLVASLAAAAAVGLWALLSLVAGATPRPPSAGGIVAGLIFVVAFLPNLAASLLALALGASVEVGARVYLQGRALGPVRQFSLIDWGGAATPWYVWAFVLIPTFACLLGGFAARRNSVAPTRVPEVLGAAAAAFALPLAAVAALSPARLGAGLLFRRGFAHVAPDAWATLFWALLWAAVVGFVGWKVGEAQQTPAGPPPARQEEPG
jgi:hypothetical protein